MRKALLFAVCCAAWLSAPASAAVTKADPDDHTGYYITMSYARPNTPWQVFFEDRNQCLSGASHSTWHTVPAGLVFSTQGGGQNYSLGGGGAYVGTSYNVRKFTNCMDAKGYRFSANGYRAVWIHQRSDGAYWMGGF